MVVESLMNEDYQITTLLDNTSKETIKSSINQIWYKKLTLRK